MEAAPSFSSVLKDCSVIEGQDFVLQCSVLGTPAPQITWLLNGESSLAQHSTLVPCPSPLGPLALSAFSLDFPVYYSQSRMPKKAAQGTER